MASKTINNYVNERYENWLDYAKYQAVKNNIGDAPELLNTVILEVLSENSNDRIEEMMNDKNNKGSQLDFFILYMLRLNASSPTSRFRYKSRYEKIDYDVDIAECNYVMNTEDGSGFDIEEKLKILKKILLQIDLPKSYIELFNYKFHGGNLRNWKDSYSLKHRYSIYNKVVEAIKVKINNGLYIKIGYDN